MKFGVPKEVLPGEARVALTPKSAKDIQKLGYDVVVQSGAGLASRYSDDDYRAVGVDVVADAATLWGQADIVGKVRPVTKPEEAHIRDGQTVVSFFYPGQNPVQLARLAKTGATIVAMDMVPRISRAQKMDALSSMANIAGYRAVIEASHAFGRFFTGQVTAAGKVPPAKVLIVGAGVAGLAAIGAATSLGAITLAFDVRPEVAEQIESMGAEFVYLDFEEGQTDGAEAGGYAKPSSPEFRAAQLAKFRELAPDVDIVITTALIPGRDAPKLWTDDMVAAMKPGSVIVDLAAERGGNCTLTRVDERFETENGVTIFGYTDFPSRMAAQSSELYANNIRHLLSDLTPEKNGQPDHNMQDDVIRGATVAHQGQNTFPPPPPKVRAIAAQKPKAPVKTSEEQAVEDAAARKVAGRRQWVLLAIGAGVMWGIGQYAPAAFMQHFIVFVLAIFVGFQVIWGVAHSLHTPLMAITNAISGIIILGSLLQVGADVPVVRILALIAAGIATINIVGGFMVTRRMLAMFRKS